MQGFSKLHLVFANKETFIFRTPYTESLQYFDVGPGRVSEMNSFDFDAACALFWLLTSRIGWINCRFLVEKLFWRFWGEIREILLFLARNSGNELFLESCLEHSFGGKFCFSKIWCKGWRLTYSHGSKYDSHEYFIDVVEFSRLQNLLFDQKGTKVKATGIGEENHTL